MSAALEYARRAAQARQALALLGQNAKRRLLQRMADDLVDHADVILEQNAIDMAAGRKNGLSKALLDRLMLTSDRIAEMAQSLRQIADLPDPVGEKYDYRRLDNGIEMCRMRTPIGTVLVIFESRPNVTSDAAGLCLKAGNTCVLRCGTEALHSATAIGNVLKHSLAEARLPTDAVTIVDQPDRDIVLELLGASQYLDLVVPRGGEGLIRFVSEHSRIPVVKHDKGVCHLYVHADAQADMASAIALNAKTQRPGVCNAIETLLIHRSALERCGEQILRALLEKAVELRACERCREAFPELHMLPATDADWDEEYLDLVLSVRAVDSLEEAVAHIREHGSGHSEAIVTESARDGVYFQRAVDAAAVYVNASTRFTDGGQFGMGAEIGISTQKLHCRGPMGVRELTSSKYILNGDGQVR